MGLTDRKWWIIYESQSSLKISKEGRQLSQVSLPLVESGNTEEGKIEMVAGVIMG